MGEMPEQLYQLHNFATRPALIRAAIEAWRPWIESKTGVPLSDSAIIETRHNLSQIGIRRILGVDPPKASPSGMVRRLDIFLVSAEAPAGMPPLLRFDRSTPELSFASMFGGDPAPKRSRMKWEDCPIALTLHTIAKPVVVLNVFYQAGPQSHSESEARILVASKDCIDQVIRLLETINERDTIPTITTYGDEARKILPCDWDEIVLDPTIVSLLKNDFETFWSKQQWFRERNIPWRRGALASGPPGNGKSMMIRAMLTSRNLSGFTLRLFHPHTTDSDLENLFDMAMSARPSMVIFEDLDRAFPRAGNVQTQVSLQALLNCLDGTASGEGLYIIATANDPAALDQAILKRPGRFDRVVNFPNPSPNLRREYFVKMKLNLEPAALDRPVLESAGFSFALCREATLLAAQFAFERQDNIRSDDLLRGVRVLRETMTRSSAAKTQAGFIAPSEEDESAA